MSIYRMRRRALSAAVVLSCIPATSLLAQAPKVKARDSAKVAKDSAKIAKAAKDTATVERFFQSETPLEITLSVNLKRLKSDTSGESPWRQAKLTYAATAPETGTVTISLRVKTRGVWRLKHCEFPPIWLNFASKDVKRTEFKGVDQIKLTSYCRNDDEYERYIVQELELNRALRVLTPFSHAVRAAHITYVDSATGKKEAARWAFFQEEPLVMAGRLQSKILKTQNAGPDDVDPFHSALFGVFEYFIGNTDFSIADLHNVELLRPNNVRSPYPVPHDFDYSGAVNTRYAIPAPQLSLPSVRDRLFRGYCAAPAEFEKVFALFRAKKDSIYALYRDPIGKLLPENTVKETLSYFDDFYRVINSPTAAGYEIVKVCLRHKA
jgi:hypothetical protein